jgi:Glycoside hydrolase family 44/Secretion system C-terminal sorting domain
MKKILSFFFLTLLFSETKAQVSIKIDAKSDLKPVSPYIYGRNNSIASTNPTWTISDKDLVQIRDAGVTFFRESGGNNCTKYNWRRKLQSHPDWYNNVYKNDWGNAAKTIQKNFPNAQGMWAFQLIGKAAKTNAFNFKDWEYNRSQWWEGTAQNLAGNGVLNTTGNKAKTEGDPNLYLENWTADSTVAIIDNWFSKNGLDLNKDKIKYWNMDNEPEIWNGTHDDIMPKLLAGNDYIIKYVEVARAARAKYPNIKLVGPVTANEWQWYNWDNNAITFEGKNYCNLEFFIKRIADEQKKSGTRLLDVLDIHFYPATKKQEDMVQLHRVFFDRNYTYPDANGVKRVSGNWDATQNKEYIFGRINDWLNQYFGANHGITLGLTEIGVEYLDASTTSVWYASMMGEFMKNNVEIFTPWTWQNGMWETLHLFTRYNKANSVKGESSNELLVSAYPTINNTKDSMSVVLVNRSPSVTQSTTVEIDNFIISGQDAKTFTLKSLPNSETFISRTQNALAEGKMSISSNKISITLAPMSVTTVVLAGKEGQFAAPLSSEPTMENEITVFPNPSTEKISIELKNQAVEKIELFDLKGIKIAEQAVEKNANFVEINQNLRAGTYIIKLNGKAGVITKKVVIEK